VPVTTPPPVAVPPAAPAAGAARPASVDRQLPTKALVEEESVPPVIFRVVSPHPKPASSDPLDRNDPNTKSALSESIPTIAEIMEQPARIAAAFGVGSLILLLFAIPAEILDSTLEANAHRVRKLLAPIAPLLARWQALKSRLPRLPISTPLLFVLTSVAFGFTDPQFGFDLTSLRTTLALGLGLALVLAVPLILTRTILGSRFAVDSAIVAYPGAMVVAVVGVFASRLLGFTPGLLIGLLVGLKLAESARADDRRRAVLIRFGTTLVIAVGSWIGYSWMLNADDGSGGFFMLLASDTLAAAVVEGLTGLVVALLPIAFLDGKTLFDGSKKLWAAIALPVAVAFALFVLPTAIGPDGPESPIWLWVVLLLGFSAIVAAVWFGFWFTDPERTANRDKSESTASPADTPVLK